jgi:TonB family protein
MWSRDSLRYSVLIATAALVSVLWSAAASAESDLERHLNDEYKGKTFILRGFYSGDHLKYDSGTRTISPSSSDDWTVSGIVQVEYLRLSGNRLGINARRLHMGWLDGHFQELHDHVGKLDKDERTDRSLRIEADLGAENADSAERVLSEIFLTTHDRFADLVPEYWKACVLAALTGKGSHQYSKYSFSQDFAAIPGVSPAKQESAEAEETTAGQPHVQSFRPGKGVSPPRVVSQNDPEFSDGARRAKYQGIEVLSMVVGHTGRPQNIQIVQPLGMGLDRKAVEAVSKWHFNPGTKDGEPVDVEIAVEVDFHLH